MIKKPAVDDISAVNIMGKTLKAAHTQTAITSMRVITVPLNQLQKTFTIRLYFAIIVLPSSPLHASSLDHYFYDDYCKTFSTLCLILL